MVSTALKSYEQVGSGYENYKNHLIFSPNKHGSLQKGWRLSPYKDRQSRSIEVALFDRSKVPGNQIEGAIDHRDSDLSISLSSIATANCM